MGPSPSVFNRDDADQVVDLFEQIAPHYDRLNDLLSLGLHRHWKRSALHWLSPRPGQALLDLCCGSGDLALLMAAAVRPGGSVLGLDAAAAPLALARRRSARQPWLSLHWLQGDALATGLEAETFDAVAMAYGLRNLSDPAAGLAEVLRLLRPGGRAAVLDFNRPEDERVAAFQRAYLRRLVVPVARRAGLEPHYAYLERSIAHFPTAARQEQLAGEVGFSHARHRPLAVGLMGLLELRR